MEGAACIGKISPAARPPISKPRSRLHDFIRSTSYENDLGSLQLGGQQSLAGKNSLFPSPRRLKINARDDKRRIACLYTEVGSP